MAIVESRVYHFRFINFTHQVAATVGLLMCFIFSEFADFQRVYTGGHSEVEPFVTTNELFVFTIVLIICAFSSSFMQYVSEARANTGYFCYYLLVAICACLLSFFSVAHIWTLLQIIHKQLESEERALDARFLGWYFYRLFILAICYCFCCGCSLFTLLMYRSVKETVHGRHAIPNFRYVTISHA